MKNCLSKIETKEAAYVLGLLWADGSLDGKYRVRIGSAYDDLITVEKIFLKTGEWKVNFSPRWQPTWKDKLIIGLSDKNLVSFLTEHSYASKSDSACSILSQIPDNLKPYWFRGLIDGDGSFYLQKTKKNLNSRLKFCFSCYSSYEQDWTYLENLLKSLDITYYIDRRDRGTHGKGSEINIFKKQDINKLGEYIYKNYDKDKIGLERKYQNFLSIINLRS